MKRSTFYKCEKCGNIVVKVVEGGGELCCCGQPMSIIEANTTDAAKEKHVPAVKVEGDVIVMEFEARFFLWNMIRRMVAAIQSVGKGIHTLDDVHRALDDLQEINFGVARPDALTLMDVKYDWLTFTEADPEQFSERKDEFLFGQDLRRSFYESL